MLMPREKKILSFMMKSHKKLTTSEIAVAIGVSTRTVKSDIKRINEELKAIGCSIATRQGVGMWVEYDKDGEIGLHEILKDQNLFLAPEERKYYVAAEILMADAFISMEQIAGKYYVSKGTVVNDVNELDPFWEKFGLTFIRRVKYGIRAEGTEEQLRRALIYALKKMAYTAHGINYGVLNNFFQHSDTDVIRNIIMNTEKTFAFILSDISFEEFLIRVQVCIERSETGRNVKVSMESDEITQVKSHRLELIVHYLKEQILEEQKVDLPAAEILYLLQRMRGLSYQIPPEKDSNPEQVKPRNSEMFDFMMKVLEEIDKNRNLSISRDMEMNLAMFNHLECMIYRMRNRMFINNPILHTMKQEMAYEYDIATYLVSRFADHYDVECTEDEIAYITFYVGTAIERQRQEQECHKRVTIVCATGMASSQFLATKLRRLLPELDIVQILSRNQAMFLKPDQQDFVIATIPLILENIPVIQVSTILNPRDVERLRSHITTLHVQEIHQEYRYSCLRQYLHSEISILNVDLRSKEEALELLGGRMTREGYVDAGYVESVKERERVSETAVGNLIAIPHAYHGHVKKQGIGLMTLQHPISWGSERVQIIFMIGLLPGENNDFQGIFDNILDLTKNIHDLNELTRCRKFSELSIIKEQRNIRN